MFMSKTPPLYLSSNMRTLTFAMRVYKVAAMSAVDTYSEKWFSAEL